jgi:NitT/TauT family transport system ATP-binding protein
MSAILECRDISLYYQDSTSFILKDINLSVQAGEIAVLLGESGCGKTSLLNVAGGLLAASSGQVLFRDRVLKTTPSGISVVFQDACLLPWLNVAGNVGFGLDFRSLRVPKAEIKARVREALREVGLAGESDKYPRALSGGMAQRAALARTLARRSELSLLDEPFSSLDAITRRSMQQLLLSLMRTHQSSALMVTHDLDEALILADRLFLMRREPRSTSLTSWDLNDLLGPAGSCQDPVLRSRSSSVFAGLREEISEKISPCKLPAVSAET